MSQKLGKWQQYLLLQQDSLCRALLPQTTLFTAESLLVMLDLFEYVYVKHDSLGQGRGLFKVMKKNNGDYYFNGFTIHGRKKNMCVSSINDFLPILHPYAKFGRPSGSYIIQEGIKSLTLTEQPFVIRIHIQILKGEWVIGGMYAKIASHTTEENGIVNIHRGAQLMPMNELLHVHLKMKKQKSAEVIHSLHSAAVSVAKVVAIQYPNREYGLDFGLNQQGKPVLFEVNTTPGIRGFAAMEEMALWRRIVNIRKQQKEE